MRNFGVIVDELTKSFQLGHVEIAVTRIQEVVDYLEDMAQMIDAPEGLAKHTHETVRKLVYVIPHIKGDLPASVRLSPSQCYSSVSSILRSYSTNVLVPLRNGQRPTSTRIDSGNIIGA